MTDYHEIIRGAMAGGKRRIDSNVPVGREFARAFLDLCAEDHQRNQSVDRVNLYCADMTNGKWGLGGTPLAVSTEGLLIQGAHRMTALNLAATVPGVGADNGLELPFDICWNAEPNEFGRMDIGLNRSAAHFLQIGGHRVNSGKVAAIVRVVDNFNRRKADWPSWRRTNLSAVELLALADEYGEHALEAHARISKIKRLGVAPASFGAAYVVQLRAWPQGKDALDEYVFELANGHGTDDTGLNAKSPSFLLRGWLTRQLDKRNRTSRAIPRDVAQFHLFLRCFKARESFEFMERIGLKGADEFQVTGPYQGPTLKA